MAITRISEFTFGFAFLFEQAARHWGGLTAAPILPSLKQEEEEGWDAKLPTSGVEYYYQFKMSDYLWAGHAKYRKAGPDKKYDAPYFRISLHKHNNNQQHQRLRALCVTKPHTYYVAPEMKDLTAFNSVFLARQMTNSSRLIPVSECADYHNGAQHYITFQEGSTDWMQHSEPVRHSGSERGRDIENMYRRDAGTWKPINVSFAENLLNRTRTSIVEDVSRERDRPRSRAESEERDAILQLLDQEPAVRTRATLIRRSAELVSLYFGATMMLVGARPDGQNPPAGP